MRELQAIARDAGHDAPLMIGGGPGGRPGGAHARALDGLAAAARAGAHRVRGPGAADGRGAGRGAARLRHQAATSRRSWTWTRTPTTPSSATARSATTPSWWAAWAPRMIRGLQGNGVAASRQALPRARRHRPRFPPRPAHGRAASASRLEDVRDAAVPRGDRGRGGHDHDGRTSSTRSWTTVSPPRSPRHVVEPLLRGELKYDGVVLTDDLEMKAVADRWKPAESAVLAAAGRLRRHPRLRRPTTPQVDGHRRADPRGGGGARSPWTAMDDVAERGCAR